MARGSQAPLPTLTIPTPRSQSAAGVCPHSVGWKVGQGPDQPGPSMLPTSTHRTGMFQDCLHGREMGPGRQAPCSGLASCTRLITSLQRLSELDPGEPGLQESRWRPRKGSEPLPETTQQVSAVQPPRPAHSFQSHRSGVSLGLPPMAHPLPKGPGGALPTVPSTTPAGGLVTPSLREIEDEGLQMPHSPPRLPGSFSQCPWPSLGPSATA